jgi:hypothetical protein
LQGKVPIFFHTGKRSGIIGWAKSQTLDFTIRRVAVLREAMKKQLKFNKFAG